MRACCLVALTLAYLRVNRIDLFGNSRDPLFIQSNSILQICESGNRL